MSETTVATHTPNLNKALSLLQGEMPKVTKTKTGKIEGENKAGKYFSYEYSYADLGDVVADMGPLMAKHGLAFHCAPTIDPANRGQMILAWSLLHESGEERSGEWPLGPVNQKPQSLGSAITYGRRYSFTAATNIVLEDDDDGQRAQQDHSSRQSAGDLWDKSTPVPPSRQDGSDENGQRPMNQGPRSAEDQAVDHDAQKYADKAHKARIPAEIEAIHREAREAGKVASFIRNPASRGVGKLAVYLDWKRKQLMAAPPAEDASPVAAALDPDDQWASAFRDAADAVEAERLLADLRDQAGRGEIDPGRAALVEQAAEELFPGITAMEAKDAA